MSMHSVTLDEEGCSHYYHCVISHIPFTMPMQMVADYIVPKGESPALQELTALGCRIVPHKLHCFKEALPTKFGFVTYYIHHKAEGSTNDTRIHDLFVQWASTALPQQCEGGVQVRLAQPLNCCQAGPFLKHMNHVCKMLAPAPEGAKDAKKVETFLLTKVRFTAPVSGEAPPPSSPLRGPSDEWGAVGTITPAEIPAIELAWLRKEHPAFPEKADVQSLHDFFTAMVKPLFMISDGDGVSQAPPQSA